MTDRHTAPLFRVIREAGYEEAMLGISLNKLQDPDNMPPVAEKLSKASAGSHRKFMRQICVWIYVYAPMAWWAEHDTYKVGTVRNSSSTMHRPKLHAQFHPLTSVESIAAFEHALEEFEKGEIDVESLKYSCPAGVMLTSVVSLNYEVLRTMFRDRSNHRLSVWREFCVGIFNQLEHKEFFTTDADSKKTTYQDCSDTNT